MSETPRILFFADAGAAVGGGHVMRCLTLAQALRRVGADCAFAATPAAGAILDAFAEVAIERLPLTDETVERLVPRVGDHALAWGAHAVVMDHYGAGVNEEVTLRGSVGCLMVIDDLKRPHLCDLALDSNLDRTAEDYPGVEALTGPRFALVRAEFVALRPAALERRSRAGAPARILISLGLTDLGGVTGRVVEAILPGLGEMDADIVVGQGAPSLPRLVKLASGDPRLTLHIDTHEMAALTAAADLAIGAGGSSVWERCGLGLPSLTLVLADNQRSAAHALAARGATVVLDASSGALEGELAAALGKLAADPVVLAGQSRAASAICDGLGADRVAARLLECLHRSA